MDYPTCSFVALGWTSPTHANRCGKRGVEFFSWWNGTRKNTGKKGYDGFKNARR